MSNFRVILSDPDLLIPAMIMIDDGKVRAQNILRQQIYSHLNTINRRLLLIFNQELKTLLSSVGLKNKKYISLSGRGVGGPPPDNFENQESRRSHLWSFCIYLQ